MIPAQYSKDKMLRQRLPDENGRDQPQQQQDDEDDEEEAPLLPFRSTVLGTSLILDYVKV